MTDPRSRPRTGRIPPGLALFLPWLVWYVFQQGLGAALAARCTAGGPPIGTLWGLGSILLCALDAWLVWPAARAPLQDGTQVPRFVARLALTGASFFALAIGFQTLATLIVPPCVR